MWLGKLYSPHKQQIKQHFIWLTKSDWRNGFNCLVDHGFSFLLSCSINVWMIRRLLLKGCLTEAPGNSVGRRITFLGDQVHLLRVAVTVKPRCCGPYLFFSLFLAFTVSFTIDAIMWPSHDYCTIASVVQHHASRRVCFSSYFSSLGYFHLPLLWVIGPFPL